MSQGRAFAAAAATIAAERSSKVIFAAYTWRKGAGGRLFRNIPSTIAKIQLHKKHLSLYLSPRLLYAFLTFASCIAFQSAAFNQRGDPRNEIVVSKNKFRQRNQLHVSFTTFTTQSINENGGKISPSNLITMFQQVSDGKKGKGNEILFFSCPSSRPILYTYYYAFLKKQTRRLRDR